MVKGLFHIVAQPYFRRLEKRVRDSAHRPEAAQRKTFIKFRKFLKKDPYHFTGLEDLRTYPESDYSSIEPVVTRLSRAKSEQEFGRSKLIALGKTSGTTNKPKIIPINKRYVKSYQRSIMRMNACFCVSTGLWKESFDGKRILLVARPKTGETDSGVQEGFISGLMASFSPAWMHKFSIPSQKILALEKWDDKINPILEEARNENVRLMAGIPPLILTLTERAIEKYQVPKLNQVWPNLRLLLYGGVPITDRMKKRFFDLWGREDLVFWEMYSGTEGHFGHTFDLKWNGMVFNLLENIFLFEDERSKKRLFAHELKLGGRYNILVTTPGGLVNYRMGDCVEILSKDPLTFRVCGREKEELSLVGEKIVPDQLEKSVLSVRSHLNLDIQEYVVWAEEGTPNRLVWGLSIEGCENFSQKRIDLERSLDQALGQNNHTYGEVRINDFMYAKPKVVPLSKNVFRKYRSDNIDRGQFKGKRLFKNMEEFLSEYQVKENQVFPLKSP